MFEFCNSLNFFYSFFPIYLILSVFYLKAGFQKKQNIEQDNSGTLEDERIKSDSQKIVNVIEVT